MKLTQTQEAWLASVRERERLKAKLMWMERRFVIYLHDQGLKQKQIKEITSVPLYAIMSILNDSDELRNTFDWRKNRNQKRLSKDDSVNELSLSVRAANVLNNANISTIGELLECSDLFFAKSRNCGFVTKSLIDMELTKRGLKRNPDGKIKQPWGPIPTE